MNRFDDREQPQGFPDRCAHRRFFQPLANRNNKMHVLEPLMDSKYQDCGLNLGSPISRLAICVTPIRRLAFPGTEITFRPALQTSVPFRSAEQSSQFAWNSCLCAQDA